MNLNQRLVECVNVYADSLRKTIRLLTGCLFCIFRSKVDIDSDSNPPLIPEQSRHRFRSKVATFFRISEFNVTGAMLDNFDFIGHHIPSRLERRKRWHKRGYPCVKRKRSCA